MALHQTQRPANISRTFGRNYSKCMARPANRGAILLSRRRTGCTEFLLLSLWESLSFLESLTGPDVEGAVARELINPSPMVKNYKVLGTLLPTHDYTTLPS